jgi:hypothetical protein
LFVQGPVIEPEGRQEAGPEGFQNDVRCRRQAPEKLAAVSSVQIEGDATLGRVVIPEGRTALRVGDVIEERPNMAGGLATGGFDLDNIGPEIAEKLAAELAGLIRELQDSQAQQRDKPQPTKTVWAIGSMEWLAEQKEAGGTAASAAAPLSLAANRATRATT